jgi:hypothetical protein
MKRASKGGSASPASSSCPRCGLKGSAVQEITLKALLRGAALARRCADRHLFCPQESCAVVYFAAGEEFTVADVAAPVFQKQPPGNRLICPCFDVTEDDIRQELAETGHCTAQKRIMELVKIGSCACELRNPQGTCCLGNIAMVVKSASSRG